MLGFPLEPGDTRGVGCQRPGQYLVGHLAIESRISGPIDLPHSAHTDLGSDLIRAKAGTGGEGQVADYMGVEASGRRSVLSNGEV